ncbi:hypothetical protein EYZ11_009208 [Aspergillus tanneri]|uniref:Uncharacterized protein n=1 Tax=Aspergillus tanneri TaxID=1220188 RepID=A0A4S3J8H2_9EURO|nr:hypothetical protein EYZ11_009208 [Aspergillus tanneri]
MDVTLPTWICTPEGAMDVEANLRRPYALPIARGQTQVLPLFRVTLRKIMSG